MDRQTILLVDTDGDCEDAVAKAAARSGYSVRWVKTCRDGFQFIHDQIRDLALIVVDLDPGAHGMSLLEAISSCADSPEMIVLSALEETYAGPISQKHGAAACLSKPIDIARLARTIEEVTTHEVRDSDFWGHPQPHPAHGRAAIRRALRGITAKLSPRGQEASTT
jgi:DNA-binding NtrC family response regulator